MKRLLAPLTSLKLTVTLLALGIAVVFFGTLGQTEDGLYVAQARYFRSWFSTWSPHSAGWKWVIIPLPGGYLLGTLLLVNLLAAHAVRFKFGWKKSGILLAHLGIISLLVGQLATDMFARESRMSFAEGQWRNYTEDAFTYELVFRSEGPEVKDPALEQVVAVPESRLAARGEIRAETLPFTVRVKDWSENSEPSFRPPMVKNDTAQASQGIAQHFDFKSIPPTRRMDDKNVPSAIVELVDDKGGSLGTWAVSGWAGDPTMARAAQGSWARQFSNADMAQRMFAQLTEPQTVEVGGRKFTFTLRPTRYYLPFTVKLLETKHEIYAGTISAAEPQGIPKNFQSRVLIDHPTAGKREVDIYMNNPLRYGGLTFFQYQMGREEAAATARGNSVLQVVRNPSWLTPYIGCGLVAAGLLVQFLIHLVGFIRKRTA